MEEFYSRDPFPWERRKEDMDIWSKPPEFQKVPVSSDSTSEGSDSPQHKQNKTKLSRIEGSRAHRCAIETELVERGRYASNQLDRLQGILKDPPTRTVLRNMPVDIPALSVVNDPSVDTQAREAGLKMLPSPPTAHFHPKGFTPGTTRCDHRLTAKGNSFPIADYERKKFAGLRGYDFK